ncbi:hypothetical protein CV945_16385, partial [Geobacillus sp. Manikaran-105]
RKNVLHKVLTDSIRNKFLHQIRECGMLVHREHLLGLFVSLLTFYRKGALFSIPFGFYWIINTPEFIYIL